MSPPKVSLAVKEPLETVSDELPPEKVDNGELPSVIAIETDRRARQLRQQVKKRRCRLIICGITLLVLAAAAALLTVIIVKAVRRHHRTSWRCGVKDNALPADVHVDENNQLIHAQYDHDNDRNTPSIEVLHEYNRSLITYKDTENNTCYIDRLDETFDVGYDRWVSYEETGRDPKTLKVISQPIEVEVIQHFADVHIYAFCSNSKSYWVMEIEKQEVTTEMHVVYV